MLDRVTIEQLGAAAGAGPILIALSGGGDSVALLHLMAGHFGAARLHAAIVDHALRAGSAADAARAAEIAGSAGVTASILTLSWAEGANRAQSAARQGRYAALCAHARKLGASIIATGHTRDDQAETVLLRATRGSGWRGLAGMRALAPAPIWPEGRGLLLARPLLGACRAELRAWLKQRSAAWIEDPANSNPAYARVRARTVLGDLANVGLAPTRFAALAEYLAPRLRRLDSDALQLIGRAVRFEDETIVVDPATWRGDTEVRGRALGALIAAAGAASRMPDLGDAELTETFTLAGALVRPGKHAIRISRDPGALAGRADGARPLPPLALAPREEAVWDNRLALTVTEPGWSVIAENGKPVLARGAERRPVETASATWLLQPRVEHLLSRINDTKPV